MTETPRAKTTVTFQGIEVTATKNRLWKVEAAGRSASAPFLDQCQLAICASRATCARSTPRLWPIWRRRSRHF